MIIEKACRLCGEMKAVSNFHKKADTKDGYDHRCRECRRDIGGHSKRQAKTGYPFTTKQWLAHFATVSGVQVVGEASTLDAAREMALEALSRPVTGTKAKSQARRRLERFDELCAETEARCQVDGAKYEEWISKQRNSTDRAINDPEVMEFVVSAWVKRVDSETASAYPILQHGTDKRYETEFETGARTTFAKHEDWAWFDDVFLGENGEYLI